MRTLIISSKLILDETALIRLKPRISTPTNSKPNCPQWAQLAGVIDFEHAGFSDPMFEFLLSFFVAPELRGRGTEERYCERMGFDAGRLKWYRGLEYFDTWHWVLATGKPFVQYTSENLPIALERWLDEA